MPSLLRSGRGIPSRRGAAQAPPWTDAQGLAGFRVRAGMEQNRSLSSLIESEIIPRLMLAHSVDTPLLTCPGAPGGSAIEASDVETLAPLALQIEADALLAHVETILARGVGTDAIMVDLLAPAARLLGEYWEEDRCDFIDVTMGLWRLQEIVHEIGARSAHRGMRAAGGQSALFAPVPGDQHSFGTVVIEEVFRRDGWDTDRVVSGDTSELLARVADRWFDLIGLTMSCDSHMATLKALIIAVRSVSKNPQACVMVGGSVFVEKPDLALHAGADGTAPDARSALKLAATLVREREASRCL